MSTALCLEILTPDHVIVREEIGDVVAIGEDGEFGVLKDHAHMVARLMPGEVCYHTLDGAAHRLVVSDGVAYVSNNRVSLLVGAAERLEEIDVARAVAALHRADERLQHEHSERDLDVTRAELALRRALVRIDFANRAPAARRH